MIILTVADGEEEIVCFLTRNPYRGAVFKAENLGEIKAKRELTVVLWYDTIYTIVTIC